MTLLSATYISVGTVIDLKSSRVALPRISLRAREWLYAAREWIAEPMSMPPIGCSETRHSDRAA